MQLSPQEIVQDPEIAEVFKALPLKIQNAITTSGWEQKIRIIAQKHGLVIGDAAILESNTLLVMLGIISPKEYLSALGSEIKLNEDSIYAIVSDVNEEIFGHIKGDLITSENISEKTTTPDEVSEITNLTKDSVAAEIANHIEILPNDEDVLATAELPPAEQKQVKLQPEGVTRYKESPDPQDTSLIQEKLSSASESVKETVTITTRETPKEPIKKIDPYREMV